MSNINTWLDTAKDFGIHAPYYTLDNSATLALGLVSLVEDIKSPKTRSYLQPDSPVVVTINLVKDSLPHYGKLASNDPVINADHFHELMVTLEMKIKRVAGKFEEYWGDGYFDPIPMDLRNKAQNTFQCTRVIFIPEVAVDATHQLFRKRNTIAGIQRVAPDLEHITLWSDTKEYCERIELLKF